jgi:hypothetical protein
MNLKIEKLKVILFSDSQIVLNWIKNSLFAISQYVTAKLESIRKSKYWTQCRYVDTHNNSADIITEQVTNWTTEKLKFWLHGPPKVKIPILEYNKSFTYNSDVILTVSEENGIVNINRISNYGTIIQISVNVLIILRNMTLKIIKDQPLQSTNVYRQAERFV